MVELIRNNTISIHEQNRQLLYFSELSSRFTWLASYIETRLMFATSDLKEVIEKYGHRRVATRALSNLLNLTEIAEIEEQDTEFISISFVTLQTIRLKFNVRMVSKDTGCILLDSLFNANQVHKQRCSTTKLLTTGSSKRLTNKLLPS